MQIQTYTYGIHTNMAMIQTNTCRYCSSLNLRRALIPQAGRPRATRRRRERRRRRRRCHRDRAGRESLSHRHHDDAARPNCQAVAPECPSVIYGLPGRWWPMQMLWAKSARRAGHSEEPNENLTSAGPGSAAAARPTQAGRVQVSGLGHSR